MIQSVPPPDASPTAACRARGLALAAAFAALALGLTAPSLGFDFVDRDDPHFITLNPAVNPAAARLSGPVTAADRLLTPRLGYPIPLVQACWTALAALAGLDPRAFHAFSVALHVANVLLVLALASALGLSRWGQAVAAALFAIHPVGVEAVGWLTSTKDTLATALAMGAALVALRSSRSPSSPLRPVAATGMVALFALALASKPSVVLFPLLFLQLRWARARIDRRSALATAGMLALGAASTALTIRFQSQLGAMAEVHSLAERWERVVSAGWVQLGHLLWPVGLVPIYETAIQAPVPLALHSAVVLATGATLLALALHPRSRGGAAGFAAAWIFTTYLPSSGIGGPLVRQVGDSYLYLPLPGIACLLGTAVDALPAQAARAGRPSPRAVRAVAALIALAAWIPVYRATLASWSDSRSLAQAVLWRYPNNASACLSLGSSFVLRRDWSGGAHRREEPALHARALAIWIPCALAHPAPEYPFVLAMSLERVGEARAAQCFADLGRQVAAGGRVRTPTRAEIERCLERVERSGVLPGSD